MLELTYLIAKILLLIMPISFIIGMFYFITAKRRKEKINNIGRKSFSVCIASLVLLFIVGGIGGTLQDSEQTKEKIQEESSTEDEDDLYSYEEDDYEDIELEEDSIETESKDAVASNWEDKLKEIMAMDGNASDKFNEIDRFAYEYEPTEDEVSEFETYILAQYQSKKYLQDTSNAEYMLENIFKSSVVNRYYKDDNSNPIGKFAFDFYQNSKYVYRGVDTVGSESVLANERQMDKALLEIGQQ